MLGQLTAHGYCFSALFVFSLLLVIRTHVLQYFYQSSVPKKMYYYHLQVKTEKGSGSNSSDPYVAFRKRTEKMQTRKNRKNDESSYEKMLKLRRDLSRAVTLLEMVKRREKAKREHLHLNIEIFERRWVLCLCAKVHCIYWLSFWERCKMLKLMKKCSSGLALFMIILDFLLIPCYKEGVVFAGVFFFLKWLHIGGIMSA